MHVEGKREGGGRGGSEEVCAVDEVHGKEMEAGAACLRVCIPRSAVGKEIAFLRFQLSLSFLLSRPPSPSSISPLSFRSRTRSQASVTGRTSC